PGVRVVFDQNISELQIVIERGAEKSPISSDQIKGLPAFPLSKDFVEKCMLRMVGNRHLYILHSSQPRSGESADNPAPEVIQALSELKLPIVESNTITKKVGLPEISSLFSVQDLISHSALWINIITSLEGNPFVLHAYQDFLETLQEGVSQMSHYFMDISAIYEEMLQAFSEQDIEKGCSKLSEAIARAQQDTFPLEKAQACLDRFSLLIKERSLNVFAESLLSDEIGTKTIGFDFLANVVQASNAFINQSIRNQSLLIESMKLCFSELVISHPQHFPPIDNLRGFWPCWSVLIVFWKMVDNLFSGSIRFALSDLKDPPFEKHVAEGKGIFYAQALPKSSKCFSLFDLNARTSDFVENMLVTLDLLDSKDGEREEIHYAPDHGLSPDRNERIGAQWTRAGMMDLIDEKERLQEECISLRSKIVRGYQDCLERMKNLPRIESAETARNTVQFFFDHLPGAGEPGVLHRFMEEQSFLLREKRRECNDFLEDIEAIIDEINSDYIRIQADRALVKKIVTVKFPEVCARYQAALNEQHPFSFAVVADYCTDYTHAVRKSLSQRDPIQLVVKHIKEGTDIRCFLSGHDSKGGPPQWTLELNEWEKQIEVEDAKIDELHCRLNRSIVEAEELYGILAAAQSELGRKLDGFWRLSS
ncbi:MAG: hypothetical protein IT584_03230, partial [Chlamydiae bacterium]|nr:hypothetical protein [Chlamydiota bacterium]